MKYLAYAVLAMTLIGCQLTAEKGAVQRTLQAPVIIEQLNVDAGDNQNSGNNDDSENSRNNNNTGENETPDSTFEPELQSYTQHNSLKRRDSSYEYDNSIPIHTETMTLKLPDENNLVLTYTFDQGSTSAKIEGTSFGSLPKGTFEYEGATMLSYGYGNPSQNPWLDLEGEKEHLGDFTSIGYGQYDKDGEYRSTYMVANFDKATASMHNITGGILYSGVFFAQHKFESGPSPTFTIKKGNFSYVADSNPLRIFPDTPSNHRGEVTINLETGTFSGKGKLELFGDLDPKNGYITDIQGSFHGMEANGVSGMYIPRDTDGKQIIGAFIAEKTNRLN